MPSANKGDYDRAREAQASRDKGESKGILGGLRDLFSGAKSKSGPTAADRSRARPDVVKIGTGKDTKFMDTRTGKSYAAPSYGALSFRGLTSTDPANVARNRYGREGLEAMRAAREGRDGPSMAERGIASLAPAPAPVVDPVTGTPAPTTPPVDLGMIGAPTTPMAPTFVESPVYGLPGAVPAINYGNAFMGGPQLPPINLMDIFAAYPSFGMR